MLTEVVPDDEAAAQAAARFIEAAAREAVAERGRFDFAVTTRQRDELVEQRDRPQVRVLSQPRDDIVGSSDIRWG